MSAEHIWYTPADCAHMLDAKPHGDKWRAKCPAHQGDNEQALVINEGRDKHGNTCTLMKCFAHDCDIQDICEAMGIAVRNLFSSTLGYTKLGRTLQPSRREHYSRLKTLDDVRKDDIVEAFLVDEILEHAEDASLPDSIHTDMMRIAYGSLAAKVRLSGALRKAGIDPYTYWASLKKEQV